MGGDFGPCVTVPAALKSLARHSELRAVLVGDQSLIQEHLSRTDGDLQKRFEIRHTTQTVSMDEKPSSALRGKRDSSMRVSIDLLKAGEVQACVSAGNTGALLAIGSYVLRKQAGLKRPAICSALPTLRGHSYLLDLGANVESDPESLHQFAVMGTLLARAIDGNANPSVALLNIGHEEIKGTSREKEAAQLLQDDPSVNYIGFVEGNSLFDGNADVVVCDGFTGNIALKASEGVATFIARKINQELKSTLTRRLLGLLASPVFAAIHRKIDPRTFNGASFLGLQGVLIKSHGNADDYGFSQAIDKALVAVRSQFVELIDDKFQSSLQ